jgi:hypothetical protein
VGLVTVAAAARWQGHVRPWPAAQCDNVVILWLIQLAAVGRNPSVM